jgi:hypothetical protein
MSPTYRSVYDEVMPKNRPVMGVLRDNQMWEIDSAKTGKGADANALKALHEKMAPHWKESAMESYQSISPMGMVYNYIAGGTTLVPQADGTMSQVEGWEGYWSKFSTVLPGKCEDRSYTILRGVDKNEALAVMPTMTRLEKEYRTAIAILMERKNSVSEEAFNVRMDEIRAQFIELVDNVDASEVTKAAVAYHVSYHRLHRAGGRSVSFPWAVCFEALLSLLSQEPGRTIPVRIRKMSTAPDGPVTALEGVLYDEDGDAVGCAHVADGTYETASYEGRCFVLAPNLRDLEAAARPKTEAASFKILGFGLRGNTASELLQRIFDAEGIVTLREATGEGVEHRQIGVFVGDEMLATVAGASVFDVVDLLDTQILVNLGKSDSPTYKSGAEVRERKSLTLVGQVTKSLIPANEIFALCNLQASYWTCKPQALKAFGIERVRIQWEAEALPHKMTLTTGGRLCRLHLNFGEGKDEVMEVELSTQRKAPNGKPELDITGECPPSLFEMECASRQHAVSSLLAYATFRHAEMRLRHRRASALHTKA